MRALSLEFELDEQLAVGLVIGEHTLEHDKDKLSLGSEIDEAKLAVIDDDLLSLGLIDNERLSLEIKRFDEQALGIERDAELVLYLRRFDSFENDVISDVELAFVSRDEELELGIDKAKLSIGFEAVSAFEISSVSISQSLSDSVSLLNAFAYAL